MVGMNGMNVANQGMMGMGGYPNIGNNSGGGMNNGIHYNQADSGKGNGMVMGSGSGVYNSNGSNG